MAINVRGWFAMATRMLDETSARRQALEECKRWSSAKCRSCAISIAA